MWTGCGQDRDPGDGDFNCHPDSVSDRDQHFDAFGNTSGNANSTNAEFDTEHPNTRGTTQAGSILPAALADYWLVGNVHGDRLCQCGGSQTQGIETIG